MDINIICNYTYKNKQYVIGKDYNGKFHYSKSNGKIVWYDFLEDTNSLDEAKSSIDKIVDDGTI